VRTLSENQFHVLMAALLIGSLVLDEQAKLFLPTWSAPKVSLITLVLGLVWLAQFGAHRLRALQERIKVLQDRVERLTHRADAIEDAERARRARP
jgi:uncharacterized membrane protein